MVANFLSSRLGCRVTSILGGVIAASGYFASLTTSNVYVLYVTLGVLPGKYNNNNNNNNNDNNNNNNNNNNNDNNDNNNNNNNYYYCYYYYYYYYYYYTVTNKFTKLENISTY